MLDEVNHGLDIMAGEQMTTIRVGCQHQRGLIYVIPWEKSWVWSGEMMPGHALAGFMAELIAQNNVTVQSLMQRWGIYFRQLPLAEDDS